MRDARGGPPVVVVGGTYGGDCAPEGSNYLEFLREASEDSWGVEIRAGHFQFLDSAGFVQRAVCEEGTRRRRAGAGTEPGAHGCARGDGVPRRPEGTRAAADVANDGGDVGKRSVRGASARVAGRAPVGRPQGRRVAARLVNRAGRTSEFERSSERVANEPID